MSEWEKEFEEKMKVSKLQRIVFTQDERIKELEELNEKYFKQIECLEKEVKWFTKRYQDLNETSNNVSFEPYEKNNVLVSEVMTLESK